MTRLSQVDSILRIVENPVRRKIIKRLSQEPTYALELAKDIGETQQLVTTHLALMERDGFIGSNFESSPVGPKRKFFFLKHSAYLAVSFGPHLYNEQFLNFEQLPSKLSDYAVEFLERITSIKQTPQSPKIEFLSKLLSDIDSKLTLLEDEKAVLLFIRNLAMRQASEELSSQEKTHNEKRIMHFILDERSMDIEEISKALNLKESIIRGILEKIKDELP